MEGTLRSHAQRGAWSPVEATSALLKAFDARVVYYIEFG